MAAPQLGKAPYFSIPPHVTLSELEQKLGKVGLSSNGLVIEAIKQAQVAHNHQTRNSRASVLEEHIYPVAMNVLAYQLHQKTIGNPEFTKISPDGVVVALTHDTFDGGRMNEPAYIQLFGKRIFNLVWPLTDKPYIMEGARTYQQKLEMKFARLREAKWPSQMGGLADMLNNALCLYTPPYLGDDGQTTPKMKRVLLRLEETGLPFANSVSPDFFRPMFEELLANYKAKYPSLRHI